MNLFRIIITVWLHFHSTYGKCSSNTLDVYEKFMLRFKITKTKKFYYQKSVFLLLLSNIAYLKTFSSIIVTNLHKWQLKTRLQLSPYHSHHHLTIGGEPPILLRLVWKWAKVSDRQSEPTAQPSMAEPISAFSFVNRKWQCF